MNFQPYTSIQLTSGRSNENSHFRSVVMYTYPIYKLAFSRLFALFFCTLPPVRALAMVTLYISQSKINAANSPSYFFAIAFMRFFSLPSVV